jgi:predicted nucleic acid-binding protein
MMLEHGATLCTTNYDFRLFPGLQMLNPLKEG